MNFNGGFMPQSQLDIIRKIQKALSSGAVFSIYELSQKTGLHYTTVKKYIKLIEVMQQIPDIEIIKSYKTTLVRTTLVTIKTEKKVEKDVRMYVVKRLMNLGLKQQEAEVYLTLAHNEGLLGFSLTKISEISDIPESIVSNSLKNLVQRGFVRELPGRTKRYSFVPIKDVIQQTEDVVTGFIDELRKLK